MSSTQRLGKRADSLGRYYTSPDVAEALCKYLRRRWSPFNPATILEPSVGKGAFLHAARHAWPDAGVEGVDPDPRCKDDSVHKVTFEQFVSDNSPFSVSAVIGNPPYPLAEKHIRLALKHSQAVGMLLRLNFLGGRKRKKGIWSSNPPAVVVLSPRPSFVRGYDDGQVDLDFGSNTDSCEYALFIWDPPWIGSRPAIDFLDWKDDIDQ